MISGTELTTILHAIATGHADRALNLVVTIADIDEQLRPALYRAVTEYATPAERACALGDALRDASADQFLVNECYRLAFYTSDAWSTLSDNPLFARFSANRAAWVLDKWVHYFPIYTRHLERFRGTGAKVLEIGVYRGGGLDMWAHYLGRGTVLVGLDIDEAAVRAVAGRYPIILGDQADPEVLRSLNDVHGPFDVIIDDGGHTMEQQIVTAETMFPLLSDGGVLIVEDTHTSYWPQFGGELHSPGSFVEWSKPRIDDLHSRHHNGIDRTSVWATDLDGIHWYDSVVVLDKKHRFRPFNEMSGSASFLWADRFSEGLGVEMLATRDQAMRERDEARARLAELTAAETGSEQSARLADAWRVEEELRIARSELARVHGDLGALSERLASQDGELTRTRNELLESWEQIRAIRRTGSWRLTTPLRALRRLFD